MKRQTLIAGMLALSFTLCPFVATQAQQPAEDQVQPRFIWGIIINFALSKLGGAIWDVFTKWMEARLTSGLDSAVDHVTTSMFKPSGASIKGKSSDAVSARAIAVVKGNPETPLKLDGSQANYQGVHIAILLARADGTTFDLRPVTHQFKTGERFKLRVLATFPGELAIENINPAGARSQIYPAKRNDVIDIPAGRETILPLGENEYFQFTGAGGREQLIVNLADPRAVGAQASRNTVHRQDVKHGSNFMQEVSPNTYPFISQAIEVVHSAR